MTAQEGFVYEANVVKFLAPEGLCLNETAGASHDKPDLMLVRSKKQAGCELKITAASAGSLVLKYISGKWTMNDTTNDPEKDFLKSVAMDMKLFDLIKKQWKGVPLKRDPKDAKLKASIGNLTKEQIYRKDLDAFKEIKAEVPATVIEKYYNKKNTYYVNVGTHGFFLLGSRDPLGYNTSLKKIQAETIPEFGRKAKAIMRARVQYKGSGNYQFTFEIQFSISSSNKSPYNIGAVRKGSVNIDVAGSNFSCLL